ncbi:MAG: HAD-IA family hydrolase [Patescibacteria group bacterium]|jgi:epoxide hydrolase-like predicted phosphatase
MNKFSKPKEKFEAILFDMVGVLIFKRSGYQVFTADEINADKIEKLYNHVDDKKLLLDINQNMYLGEKELERALYCIPAKYEKFPEIWELLPKLKESYKMAVINNGNALAKKYWDERFNFSIFDTFVNSAIEGVRKPGPEIYLITCKRLGKRPEDCLFMDDSLENVEVANELGMKTIWWNKEEGRDNALDRFKALVF